MIRLIRVEVPEINIIKYNLGQCFFHQEDRKSDASITIKFTFSEFIMLRHLLCVADIRSCEVNKKLKIFLRENLFLIA